MARIPSGPTEDAQPVAEVRPPGSGGAGRKFKENFSELRVYEEMGEAIRSSIDEFLQPLQSPPDADLVVKLIMLDEFFPKSVTLANVLADGCCQKIVKLVRASTRLATVREAPTPELAKRIREFSFKPLDNILVNYMGLIKKVEVISKNIAKIRDELHRVAKQGGLPPGSHVDRGPVEKGGATEAWATEEELRRQHERLNQAKTLAYTKLVEYIAALRDLPGTALAYACDKCFSAEVNYELELEQVHHVEAALKNKMDNALETMRRVMSLTQADLERERAFIVANIEEERIHLALEGMLEAKFDERLKTERKFKKVIILIVVTVLILVVVFLWVVFTKM